MLKRIKQRKILKKKYQREHSWDEKVIYFAAKIVGPIVFLFVMAAGRDIYYLFHH